MGIFRTNRIPLEKKRLTNILSFALLTSKNMGRVNNALQSVKPVEGIKHTSCYHVVHQIYTQQGVQIPFDFC